MSRVSFRVASLFTALIASAALLSPGATAQALDDAFPQPQGWPQIQRQSVQREELGPGVAYQRFNLITTAGPLVVSIATVDLKDPRVGLTVATHDGLIVGKGERLSSMADRVAAELGINADYFDINESGSPLNLVLSGGRVLHQPSRAAAFIVDGQGLTHMGSVTLSFNAQTNTGGTFVIQRINEWSPSVDLALVTPELGAASGGDAVEVVLDAQPSPDLYRVSRIEPSVTSPIALQSGQLAIVGRGPQGQSLLRAVAVGDTVTLSETSDPPVANARLGIGGGPLLVQDGKPVADPAAPAPEETDVRNPVTAVGVSADGATLWLVVVDGRRPALSIGLTRPQLAALFVAIGANTAMAFDSGGSSEMVIRHEGDAAVSVANSPSDGRERAVADGLFVLNTGAHGPATALLLKAPATQVLVGSTLLIQPRAVDANDQPVGVEIQDVALAAIPPTRAAIDPQGRLRVFAPGDVEVTASLGDVHAHARVRGVPRVDDLRITPKEPAVAAGGTIQLAVQAASSDGLPIAVDPDAVRWSAVNGKVSSSGVFIAGPRASRTTVSATVGGAVASVDVLTGDHTVMFAALPQPGTAPGQWRYVTSPAALPGGVDAQAAPDGAAALRLAYDFSAPGVTRAAYAQTESVLAGEPSALSVEVYGDGNGAWLRGGYRNSDGNAESLTIARHVDWVGWKALKVAIPPQASWPITWTRLYLVESSKEAKEQGSIWFRNLAFVYPGP